MLNSAIIRQDCEKLAETFEGLQGLFNKTFLITGSNGLIGNYLVNFLDVLNEKHDANIDAYCVSKHEPAWRAERFTYLTMDLASPFDFSGKVDYIFHAAGYASPKKFLANPAETISLNVDTTRTLLRVARRYGAKFLFLSSGAVYGTPAVIPVKEDFPGNTTPFSERAPYIYSKRLGETLCHLHGPGAKVVRLGYIYGPGFIDGRVMSEFIWMGITGRYIQISSSGKELMSWCYITDALRMMLYVLLKGENSPYNIDGNSPMTVYELALSVAQFFGVKCEIKQNIDTKVTPLATILDNSKICGEFKMENFVPFEVGLQKTIEWNREYESERV